MSQKLEIDILAFATQADWRKWLEENHIGVDQGIWLRIYKKGSEISTVSYAEALDEALCFGWIDGQKKAYDAASWLQKFTPRRKRSLWSKVNIGHISRLEALGKMAPSGQSEVLKAKADGRWDAAYESSSTAEIPQDFLDRLAQNPNAKATFETLTKSQKYSIFFRLKTAKRPETRERHLQKFIDELKKDTP